MSDAEQASASAQAVAIRKIGDLEVAVINCGYIHWVPGGFQEGQDWSADAPIADDGRSILGINYAFVRTPDAVVMIDPNSFGPDDALGSVATLFPGPAIEGVLEHLKVEPEEVTHVLITHGHADHFTALITEQHDGPRFSSAQHYYPAKDFPADDATGHGLDAVRRHLGPVREAGLLNLVDGDLEVCEGVTLLSSPGESLGHQVVRLDTPSERFYYLGDLVHYPAEVDHIDWVAVGSRDLGALVPSRERIFSDAATKPSTHVFTHGVFPAWGQISQAGAWHWSYL